MPKETPANEPPKAPGNTSAISPEPVPEPALKPVQKSAPGDNSNGSPENTSPTQTVAARTPSDPTLNHDNLLDKNLLELAKHAALEAGKVIMEIYQSGDFESFSKDDASPVTTADYKANEVITDILCAPDNPFPVMSEEQNNGKLDERSQWRQYWLIDPIDGTKEFIAQSGHFAVNVAFIADNQPVIGVIYWPVKDTLYFASKDEGAFKQEKALHKGPVTPINVRKLSAPAQEALTIAISREQPPEWVMSRMSDTREYATVPLGSCSLKSCYVAEGKADVFIRIGETGEWDTGAPQCIVSEAGGSIVSVGFAPLTYNERDSLTNPDFIVTGDQRVDWQQIISS